MKNLFVTAFLIACTLTSNCQDYMDNIVKECCECLEKLPGKLSMEEKQMKLGLCMIEVSMPYKKQLKKDHGVDLDNINAKEGQKLGQVIGVKMASICPKALLTLAGEMADKENGTANEEASEKSLTGEVTKVEKEGFVIFTLKDASGKTTRVVWLTSVESTLDLDAEFETLVGKKVEVGYKYMELFDPKMKEYRAFAVATSINLSKD